jgi:uncharacterized protein YcaQ
MTRPTLRALRAHAVARSLRPAADIAEAVAAMRFVQLDPIRAPARAADLVLRQRVAGYRAGDIDRAFPALGLAEDYLHVYGVMPAATHDLLHPRSASLRFRVEREHPRLASRVLAHIANHGETHPRDLGALSRHRTTSGWGNESVATTRILEALHFRGKLRVVRRVNGVKVYALAPRMQQPQSPPARAQALLRLLVELYGPLPESTLRQLARMVADSSTSPALWMRAFEKVRAADDIERIEIDGASFLHPAGEALELEPGAQVRFLAPFDPIVWDRRRFAEFWGWEYRFEAYTPPAKRKLGYYALPLLWRDEVIGWANANSDRTTLQVAVDFVRKAPRDAAFRLELDAEVERLRECVGARHAELRRCT